MPNRRTLTISAAMPELPDITIYIEAMRERIVDREIRRVRIVSPFVLRSADPPVEVIEGKRVREVGRRGKRIVLALNDELYLVIHLMIAGRLRWLKPGAKPPGRIGLANIEFENGTLALTEASPKKRASLHVIRGIAALALHDPGGLDVLAVDGDTFAAALRRENHTLKRALTDPRLFSGIGNAYSDEILHAAQLSPVLLTTRLTADQIARLHKATQRTLTEWTERLRKQFAGKFPGPGEITAFRPDFAVHGRFGQPCPTCGTKVQRIRYAENETNYCPKCQTNGRVLADRSLSRLLREDWPRTVEELA